MIIFGTGRMRIKKYDDYTIVCENCGESAQLFSVYQQYFHVFFIPFFPSGVKSISCACIKCNDMFNQKRHSHYLSITRTPLYMYTGAVLFSLLIISPFIIGNIVRYLA